MIPLNTARKILKHPAKETGRHLGTPNTSFFLASLQVTGCMIQYYSDQWHALNSFRVKFFPISLRQSPVESGLKGDR